MEITRKKILTIGIAVALSLAIVLAAVIAANMQPKTVMYMGHEYEISTLSAETIEWLEWFNTLTEVEQMTVSYVPWDLVAGNGVMMYMGRAYRVGSLSPETVQWLAWFNTLTEDEQMMVSYVPPDLAAELTAAAAEETNVQRETVMFRGKEFEVDSLPPEVIEWLERYNEMSENMQMELNYIPGELLEGGVAVAEETNVG